MYRATKLFFALLLLTAYLPSLARADSLNLNVQWPEFLGQHDMTWDRIPHRWEVAPYTGNGNVGFLFYQGTQSKDNVISIYAGRHDYYDHRLPHEGSENLWIYRSRLPLGRFDIHAKGDITSVDLRLGLWNAELRGTIETTEGKYNIVAFSHADRDVIYFQTDASNESIKVTWHPAEPFPPVRTTLDAGGGPKGGLWDRMRKAPLPMPPAPTLSKADNMQFCLQALYDHRGETTTGWEVTGDPTAKQLLTVSVHHSFPEADSLQKVKANLQWARDELQKGTFVSSHQKWWHEYYPQSFLTIDDAEKEAFYWIQMYKFASATRGNGPIMDLMGPWYHKTFWPMVWGDLNVQLQYWTYLTANRLNTGESLANAVDKNAATLEANSPKNWKDSANLATLFPQDMQARVGRIVPDMLCWVLHNYWLHCEYAGDRDRMRDKLFPILKKTVNSYLNYLADNAVDSGDGKIHIKHSWSPEYPSGRGKDINFTIGLMRWSCQTLVDINAEHNLNDPLLPKWQNILDNLVEFQVDENGLRIGKDIPFDKPHRHYSHLLPFYPLAVLQPDTAETKQLLRTSLDHWLDVTFNREKKDSAMAVTGYTATGAASMYAMLGDAKQAYRYLDVFNQHYRVSPTTMYAEGNPVIESPLSFATCIHDMLLQSWGGKIRVFPAVPAQWNEIGFDQLRTQGAFLVSAKRSKGVTQFVTVRSTTGAPCVVKTDIPNPVISIDGAQVGSGKLAPDENGFYKVDLKKDGVVTFRATADTAIEISAVAVDEAALNQFGFNKKTERFPGHQHYKAGSRKKKSVSSNRGAQNRGAQNRGAQPKPVAAETNAATAAAASKAMPASKPNQEIWAIDSQESWIANTAAKSELEIKDGMATPTAKKATFQSRLKRFAKPRQPSSVTLKQSPVWHNWEETGNVGTLAMFDSPVLLSLGPNNYWMFARHNARAHWPDRETKPEKPFQAKPAKLDGFDVPLVTSPFPNQFRAPGGVKRNQNGYNAWQSRDMVNWVHHGSITDRFSAWMTTAEYVDGKAYFYYDFPNDQDPHLYIDDDLFDGEPGKKMGLAFNDPSHGSDCGVIRDLQGKFHIIYEDWSPIMPNRRSFDSPLAGHAVSPTGFGDFKIVEPAVDMRTKPTGVIKTFKHPHWVKEDPDRFKSNVGEYEVHEPEQECFGDWAAISVGGQYYLFGDYDKTEKGEMSVCWLTSSSIDKPFEFCGNIGIGHPDPDICFAEGKFYLATQMDRDFVSPGPWVETIEVRVGVDTDNDAKVDDWSPWQTVKEAYDYTPGFARQIKVSPAMTDLSGMKPGYGFQFEVRMTDSTENASQPILDRIEFAFEGEKK